MDCKICNKKSEKIFSKKILQKYNVFYYKCTNCCFVQTDDPFWLEESYESAITSLDIGLPQRNIILKEQTKKIINCCFPESEIFLDFGGGYGLLVRHMRDLGFNFYRQDDYCENIFAEHFDINDIETKHFDIVTAFEVFEHFRSPINEIERIFNYSDSVLFSTELLPKSNQEIQNWWYIAEETGQHIAFYANETMDYIAQKFNKNYYSDGRSLHLFTSKKLSQTQVDYSFKFKKKYLWNKLFQPNFEKDRISLLESDYNYIKNLLNS